jgi:hypothetical protein
MLSITVQLKKNVLYVFIFVSIKPKENYIKGVSEQILRKIWNHKGNGAEKNVEKYDIRTFLICPPCEV